MVHIQHHFLQISKIMIVKKPQLDLYTFRLIQI